MKSIQYKTIFSAVLGIFSFGTTAFPKFVAIFVFLLGLVIFFGFRKKQFNWRLSFLSSLFVAFYLLYIFGILFSNELANGLRYAEYKMAFLVLPLLLAIRPKFELRLGSPIIGLALGTVYLAIVGFLNANTCSSENPEFSTLICFTSSSISPIHHPSYFACFLLIAVSAAWWGFRQKWNGFKRIPIILYTIFALVMYILCFSMAGILFLGFLLISLFVHYLYKRFGRLTAASFFVLAPILFFLIVFNSPGLGDDIKSTTTSFREYVFSPAQFLKNNTDYSQLSGNERRLVMWTVTSELIVENPLGVGTGNVDDVVFPRLQRYNYPELVTENLNPHNQYLQTSLEIGILGGLVFVSILFLICQLGWRKRNLTLFLLGSTLAFNSLFESMWQHQSGIIFYTFWVMLFLIYFNQEKTVSK